MLAAGWDQCAFNAVLSPAAAAAERVARPLAQGAARAARRRSVGFVTGAQGQHRRAGRGRHQVLEDAAGTSSATGCSARRRAGRRRRERHATIDRSLRLLGLGTRVVEPVRRRRQRGDRRQRPGGRLASRAAGRPIVCLQAGNVNTGALRRPAAAIATWRTARRMGSRRRRVRAVGGGEPGAAPPVGGVELADSWGCDGTSG